MPGSNNGEGEQPRLEDLIPLSKAAKLSGLTQDHLRRLIREQKLWGRKIGWGWVTTKQAIKEYLAQDRRPGPKSKQNP